MRIKANSIQLSVFAPLVLLIAIGVIATLWVSKAANNSHARAQAQQDHMTAALEAVYDTKSAFNALDEYVSEVASLNRIISRAEVSAEFTRLSEDITSRIDHLLNFTNVGIKETLVDNLKTGTLSFLDDASVILGVTGSRSVPTLNYIERERAHLQIAINQVYELARENDEHSVEKTRKTFQMQIIYTLIALGIFFVLGAIIAIWQAGKLSQALSRLSGYIGRISSGHFDETVSEANRTDEIGTMARSVQTFAAGLRELTEAKECVEHMAMHDPLTGLKNRRAVEEKLAEISKSPPTDLDIVALHIDLDRFKLVNDTHGHAAGDTVLKIIAQAMLSRSRESDFMARIGGDEFIILSLMPTDEDNAIAFAERICNNIAKAFQVQNPELAVTLSVGVAFFSQSNCDPDLLLENADIALYDAKNSGRRCVSLYSKARRLQREQRLKTLKELQIGLKADELTVYFQPQINGISKTVVGMESLVRWNHPERGLLAPGAFLDIAFENDLGDAITNVTIEKSVQALKKWMQHGLNGVRVSINLAASQLRNPTLVDNLCQCLLINNVQPQDVVIEIVESVLFGDSDDPAVAQIHRLQDLGFPIELDDFGTGHASISNLTHFQVEKIKIDRTFVSGISESEDNATITAALIDLARNLGIQSLAEGVETDADKEKLIELGCHEFQGYGISRPLSYEAALTWLMENHSVSQQAI